MKTLRLIAFFLLALLPRCVLAAQDDTTEVPRDHLWAWYDAADDGACLTEGEGVSAWKDKSGQGHDLTQAAANARPRRVTVNGVNVITAEGNRSMAAANDVKESLGVMTVHALVCVAPGNTPILNFRSDRTEFIAAGWTVGAKPTIYSLSGGTGAQQEVEDSQWHVLSFVRKGAERRFYVDGVPAGGGTSKDEVVDVSALQLFAWNTGAFFNGKLAELLIYSEAQDVANIAQVNAYLRHKWSSLFAPTRSGVVVFVGNSLTTGMYCGNGKTWTAQAAGKVPGLTRWYNVSQGGITTQKLAELSGEQVDKLLPLSTGNNVLAFWEGTNDLVVNKATPEAAQEAIKQFCLARRKAGWKKIVVITVLPREAGAEFETRRQTLNQLMRDNWKDYADALIDAGSNADIGQPGVNASKELFADGVHLTAKGNAVLAGMVAPVLSELLNK